MVYAMFSIGILGFIVWSQVVALLYCEVELINIAICWNSSILIGTLNSKNSIIKTQSAGNLSQMYFTLAPQPIPNGVGVRGFIPSPFLPNGGNG